VPCYIASHPPHIEALNGLYFLKPLSLEDACFQCGRNQAWQKAINVETNIPHLHIQVSHIPVQKIQVRNVVVKAV